MDSPEDVQAIIEELEAYFRSGNDVPVERATIPTELADRILSALRWLTPISTTISSDVAIIGVDDDLDPYSRMPRVP